MNLPDFFAAYLAALTDDQAQAMYLLACNDPGTQIRDAIMDATQSRGNDVYE
jgi:hypothetical protein